MRLVSKFINAANAEKLKTYTYHMLHSNLNNEELTVLREALACYLDRVEANIQSVTVKSFDSIVLFEGYCNRKRVANLLNVKLNELQATV